MHKFETSSAKLKGDVGQAYLYAYYTGKFEGTSNTIQSTHEYYSKDTYRHNGKRLPDYLIQYEGKNYFFEAKTKYKSFDTLNADCDAVTDYINLSLEFGYDLVLAFVDATNGDIYYLPMSVLRNPIGGTSNKPVGNNGIKYWKYPKDTKFLKPLKFRM